MFAFLLTPLGKMVEYAIAAVAIILLTWGIIVYHDHQVKQLATLQYNQTQLEQTVKDQADQINKFKQMNSVQGQVLSTVQVQNDTLSQKTDSIKDYLNTLLKEDVKADPVSPVILDTLKKLKEVE